MGLKENFNQAMKDLLNRGGLVGPEAEEQPKPKSDLDSYLDAPSFSPQGTGPARGAAAPDTGTPGMPGNPAGVQRNTPFDQDTDTISVGVTDSGWQAPPFEGQGAYRRPGYTPQGDGEFGRMFRPAEEMTIISKSTLIVGDIKTLASITIGGSVRGNVDVLKDANLHGMLIGDLTCNNSDIRSSSIQGNIKSKGSTYLDSDSILLGDITAQFASIDGKVKGNIDIGSKVELQRNAIVAGNINTNTISIEDGANIRGFIYTSFLKEHGDNAFPKQVVINSEPTE